MNEERPTDLLSALPRTRPHRRSDKRGARSEARKVSADEPVAPREVPTARRASSTRKPPAGKAAAPKPPAGKTAARKAPAGKAAARKAPVRKPAARKTSPTAAKRLSQPAQPRGIPDARRAPKRKPARTAAPELVGTAVQAVGELAEIGLTLTARALRNAVERLPKP